MIFAALLMIVIIIAIADSGSEERTFRGHLAPLDTTAITSISLYPQITNFKEVKLFREADTWKIELKNGSSVPVMENRMQELFSTFDGMKPLRVASTDEDRWAEYQVDTSGTRVVVKSGDSEVLDVVIGKYAFRQPRTMNSYVRLTGEDEVYEVEGFLQSTFNREANSFRNNKVISSKDYNNWRSLTFEYNADSSFQLTRQDDGNWMINNQPTDSALTAKYLSRIQNVAHNDFIDDPDPAMMRNPAYTLSIKADNQPEIKLHVYTNDMVTIVASSQNRYAYFDDANGKLRETIFVGPSKFMK